MEDDQRSKAEILAGLPVRERKQWIYKLSKENAAGLAHHWPFWARPKQRAPGGSWRFWLLMAGRGYGKTRCAAEWVRERVEAEIDPAMRIALVGRTAADVRDVMIEGRSGILSVFPADRRPEYEPSKRRITFHTGAVATAYTADEPDLLRGPEHDLAWADEMASWFYSDAWDQLNFGLRIGNDPRAVITTTPRPKKIIKDLVNNPSCVVTRGSTYENRTNLAPAFFSEIISKYEGTTLGEQELHGRLLDDLPGALWTRDTIERTRVKLRPEMTRIVVAIDPATTSGDNADDTGIVVAGLGVDGHGYVLSDVTCHKSPAGWARVAVDAYHTWKADRVIGETNNGGEMIGFTVNTIDPSVPYSSVHASRGKQARAEPVSALFEQGRCHVLGMLRDLEDEMTGWVPGVSKESPNRVDATVWALTELMLGPQNRTDLRFNAEAGLQGRQWEG